MYTQEERDGTYELSVMNRLLDLLLVPSITRSVHAVAVTFGKALRSSQTRRRIDLAFDQALE